MPYEDYTVGDGVGDGYGEIRDNDYHNYDDANDNCDNKGGGEKEGEQCG